MGTNTSGLRPIQEILAAMTDEERAACKKRGVAKQKDTAKKNKTIKDIYNRFLSMDAPEYIVADLQKLVDNNNEFCVGDETDTKISLYDALGLSMLGQAIGGDVKAATFVRDSVGDAPTKKEEITTAMTDGDRALLEKIGTRLEGQCAHITDNAL